MLPPSAMVARSIEMSAMLTSSGERMIRGLLQEKIDKIGAFR